MIRQPCMALQIQTSQCNISGPFNKSDLQQIHSTKTDNTCRCILYQTEHLTTNGNQPLDTNINREQDEELTVLLGGQTKEFHLFFDFFHKMLML